MNNWLFRSVVCKCIETNYEFAEKNWNFIFKNDQIATEKIWFVDNTTSVDVFIAVRKKNLSDKNKKDSEENINCHWDSTFTNLLRHEMSVHFHQVSLLKQNKGKRIIHWYDEVSLWQWRTIGIFFKIFNLIAIKIYLKLILIVFFFGVINYRNKSIYSEDSLSESSTWFLFIGFYWFGILNNFPKQWQWCCAPIWIDACQELLGRLRLAMRLSDVNERLMDDVGNSFLMQIEMTFRIISHMNNFIVTFIFSPGFIVFNNSAFKSSFILASTEINAVRDKNIINLNMINLKLKNSFEQMKMFTFIDGRAIKLIRLRCLIKRRRSSCSSILLSNNYLSRLSPHVSLTTRFSFLVASFSIGLIEKQLFNFRIFSQRKISLGFQ